MSAGYNQTAVAVTRLLLLSCWAAVSSAALAADEPLVMNVWPGETVGDFGDIGPERVRTPDEAPTPDAKWLTNVTVPTITVYQPEKGKNARSAMIVCPGGGYWNLAIDKEGKEVAEWLQSIGVTGVVLKYRVPRRPGQPESLPAPGPLLDAQRAVSLVRSKATEWEINPDRIGIGGFSAGGHLALMTATNFDQRKYEPVDEVDAVSCKPNFAMMAYPGYILSSPGSGKLADYIQFPEGTGPLFIVHASDDEERGAQPEQSLALYTAARNAGIDAELHVYGEGKHGFGVRDRGLPVSRWKEVFAGWLKKRGILPLATNVRQQPERNIGRNGGADRRNQSAGWELIWADEFEVNGRPSPANWTYETGFVRNEELQWYQPNNATCVNGLLVLTAGRERVANLHHAPDAPDWAKRRPHADYTSRRR
jgi:acetyl esterase/lipase